MPYTYNAIVQRVIDGDTIVANLDLGFGVWRMAQTFRLLGINAREKSDEGGSAATEHLKAILPFGAEVMLRSVKPDKFGNRYDAIVQLADGTDIASALIAGQWAAAWNGKGQRPVPPWPRTAQATGPS